jgi:hypothetical protein
VQWKPLIAVGVTTTVVGGLLLKAILSLSFHDLALYAGVPLAGVFVLLILLGLWANRRARKAEEVQWRAAITHAVETVLHDVQRLTLADVIEAAEGGGWTVVANEDGGLLFISPDDPPDHLLVPYDESDTDLVAARLHNLAPLFFDDDWEPPSDALPVTLADLHDRLDALEAHVGDLGHRVDKASVSEAVREAEAEGWDVTWDHDKGRVAFNRRLPNGQVTGVSLASGGLDGHLIREALRTALPGR